MRGIDILLVALQAYFVLMNVTVERCYCHLTVGECVARGHFLAAETQEFCLKYNPLFLARPEWMRIATCMSAYAFAPCYVMIGCAAIFDKWVALKMPICFFIGAKLYALMFYHTSEFLSSTPPQDPVIYFSVEGPYLVSIALVLYRIAESGAAKRKSNSAVKYTKSK